MPEALQAVASLVQNPTSDAIAERSPLEIHRYRGTLRKEPAASG